MSGIEMEKRGMSMSGDSAEGKCLANDPEDLEIIDLFWDRNEEAIAKTERKYDRYLRKISGNVLDDTDDVSECVSDTYLGAWDSIPPARPNILRVYLGKIARNLSLKKFRTLTAEKRGGGQSELALGELAELIPDERHIDERLEAQELADLINVFLESKAQIDRGLFISRYWGFHSIDSLAKGYGLSESNVKMKLKRTRDELKDYLAERGIYV